MSELLENEPLVSVLLCSNRMNKFIFSAINSILEQTYENLDIVVVLNGPSRNLIKKRLQREVSDRRLRIIVSDLDGLVENLNYGLKICKSKYVARMDDDDVSLPYRIRRQMDFLLKNPNVAVIGGRAKLIDESSLLLKNVKLVFSSHLMIFVSSYLRNPVIHPSVILNFNVIEAKTNYPNVLFCEDYSLWINLLHKKQLFFYNLPLTLIHYRVFSDYGRFRPKAYSNQLKIQLSFFLSTWNPLWLLGALLSSFKFLYRWVQSHT